MKARKQDTKAIFTFEGSSVECRIVQQYSNGYYLIDLGEPMFKVVSQAYITELN